MSFATTGPRLLLYLVCTLGTKIDGWVHVPIQDKGNDRACPGHLVKFATNRPDCLSTCLTEAGSCNFLFWEAMCPLVKRISRLFGGVDLLFLGKPLELATYFVTVKASRINVFLRN